MTFSIFTCFLHIQPAVFQVSDKIVILKRNISNSPQNRHPERSASQIYRKQRAYSAESKDPGDAYPTHAVGSFSPRKPPPGGPKCVPQEESCSRASVVEKLRTAG